jgi:glycosyltransferase involved in cell wall biosynthesis
VILLNHINMNIWIISLFDPTLDDETRPMRFAGLSSVAELMGNNVTYFSNTFRHSTKKNRFLNTMVIKKNDHYKTVYIKSLEYKKNISFKRFFSHFIYARNFMTYIQSCDEKPDVIVSALPPLVLNYELVKWAKQNRVKFVVDIIDPWPDVFFRYVPRYLRLLAKFFFLPYEFILNSILKRVDGVASISNEYIIWAVSKSKMRLNTHVSYPSIDLDRYTNIIVRDENHFNHDKLRIVYAGNLGVSYDIPCVLRAAKTLEDQFPGKTEFFIAGLGVYVDLVKEYQIRFSNIKYVGRLDFDDLMKLYSRCHLGLAQYAQGATQTVTYKLFDYLGSGLPILNSLHSEMWDLIEGSNLGLNNEVGNSNELVDNILFFFNKENLVQYSANALKYTSKYGDNKQVYKEYNDFLMQLVVT